MPKARQVEAAERPAGLRPRNGGVVKPPRGKRTADENMESNPKTRKRAAFGDLTNAVNERQTSLKNQVKKGLSNIVNGRGLKQSSSQDSTSAVSAKKFKLATAASSSSTASKTNKTKKVSEDLAGSQSLPSSQKEKLKIVVQEEDESEYESAEENLNDETSKGRTISRYEPPTRPIPPPGVADFDLENWEDPGQASEYAMDIFVYYKTRERQFCVEDYISKQPDVTKVMRAILVDWLVEVQESFELNHETLYTAVKVLDLYMSKKTVPKEDLQLVGATACLIACKIDERIPPCLDDFVYVCDDAYTRQQIKTMERDVLNTIDFDVGYPLSYRFVRRYGRVCRVELPVLTMARYILETALQEYKFNVETSESMLAAAALVLSLKIHKVEGAKWVNTLAYYSGYTPTDLIDLVQSLLHMLKQYPKENLKTVRMKYSHKVFHEVASIALPDTIELTESG